MKHHGSMPKLDRSGWPREFPGWPGPKQSTQGSRTPLLPLPRWRSVQRKGCAQARGQRPPTLKSAHLACQGDTQGKGRPEAPRGRGGHVGGRPASHLLHVPSTFSFGSGLACGRNRKNVQSNQRDWLGVSSDSRTLGNGNSAKRGSVKDDLDDR